jgi:hypothetical protein
MGQYGIYRKVRKIGGGGSRFYGTVPSSVWREVRKSGRIVSRTAKTRAQFSVIIVISSRKVCAVVFGVRT